MTKGIGIILTAVLLSILFWYLSMEYHGAYYLKLFHSLGALLIIYFILFYFIFFTLLHNNKERS